MDIGHSDLEIVEWPKVAPDRDLTSIRIPSYKDAARGLAAGGKATMNGILLTGDDECKEGSRRILNGEQTNKVNFLD